ncbi:MAG: ImmA/IrrE family metallo-endopeptidase, partial [Jatrophihabitantaceae bacterium]
TPWTARLPSRLELYDPWRELRENWPEIEVVSEPMSGGLLGELRYPVIALRSGTSAAQRRCTLAHELVHLERGVIDCGPWSAREELRVHAEAARRLVGLTALARAMSELGGDHDVGALAGLVDVDQQTMRLRLRLLTPRERSRLRAAMGPASGWVA